MSGHSPRPVFTGGSVEAFQSLVRAWEATSPTSAQTFQTVRAPPPIDGGGGGGTAPTPFSQTQAGLTFAATQQQQLLAIQRESAEALARRQQVNALIIQRQEQAFQREQLQRRFDEERKVRADERERTRQANIRTLRVERQQAFSQLLASGDQVRAVMFALGFGPENDVFDLRAKGLGTTINELKGARALERTTESALSRVLDRSVDIGREGVRGLGTAISSARAFVQGGADIQTLLASAFGVGSLREGEQPGISQARLTELIQEVVPQGVL